MTSRCRSGPDHRLIDAEGTLRGFLGPVLDNRNPRRLLEQYLLVSRLIMSEAEKSISIFSVMMH